MSEGYDTPETDGDGNSEDADHTKKVSVDTGIAEVKVRDDSATLQQLEEAADRLIDRAEKQYEEYHDPTDADGQYR